MQALEQVYTHHGIRLKELLRGIVSGGEQWQLEVFGLSQDSREVKRGDLFFACIGEQHDARIYVEHAVRCGAVAVLTESEEGKAGVRWHKLSNGLEAPVFTVPALREKMGLIADRFYSHPSTQMSVVGITGTNGKTSCSHIIASVLQRLNRPCGLLGTLGYGFPGSLAPSAMSTPDAITLQHELAGFCDQGAQAVVMEVSSHALSQGRVLGTSFDVGVFTNLTRDHLDYHGDMGRYASAKRQLFDMPTMQAAVINVDDPFGYELAKDLANELDVYAYTIKGTDFPGKKIVASNIVPAEYGFKASVSTPWGDGIIQSPFLGRFNVSNLLAVLGVLCQMGTPLDVALARLAEVEGIRGRMEAYGGGERPLVVVDYAHTPDALEQSLIALREHCKRKLWCVFGCGGERDAGKRALMGRVAERYSDQLVITDDNPRNENAQKIIDDITSELLCSWAVEIERDRYTAIAYAIHNATPEDVILVAGKGHEEYQIIGNERLVFNDAEQVQLILSIEKSMSVGCE